MRLSSFVVGTLNATADRTGGDASPSGTTGTSIIYVDIDNLSGGDGSSWANALPDLHLALEGNSNVLIWVAEGEYSATPANFNPDISFIIGYSVQLYGGFQGNDITLGQRDPELYKTTLACSGNQFHVVVTTENNASIDGFTITGGNAVGTSGARFNGGGILIGGALFTDSHSPLGDLTIVNRCSFTKNYISIDSGDPYSMGGAAIKLPLALLLL